jgi:hypothetical protein
LSANLTLVSRDNRLVGHNGSWGWSWGWGRSRSIGWLGRGNIGDRGTLVLDISDISRGGIEDIVGHNLDAAIGKSNAVTSVGGVSVNEI